MKKIDEVRSRLAALTAAEAEAPDISPGEALVVCRSTVEKLRKLKKEVLAHLLTLRSRAREHARRSLGPRPPGPRPSLRDLWERRNEGARELLDDVRDRVVGLLDDQDPAVVDAWAEVSREIDVRLDRLRELERKLARAAGGDRPLDLGAPDRRVDRDADDELYAAVGAEVQKEAQKKGAARREGEAFCTQCGRAVVSSDRFCRHCGHRLS